MTTNGYIDFVLTDEMREELRRQDNWLKHRLGRYDIEKCLMDSEQFDRRKFGKIQCPFCDHQFNPFYYKTHIQGKWNWVWQGDSHREPESDCEIPCPKCDEKLFFTLFIGQ